jgi:hypothetical protein
MKLGKDGIFRDSGLALFSFMIRSRRSKLKQSQKAHVQIHLKQNHEGFFFLKKSSTVTGNPSLPATYNANKENKKGSQVPVGDSQLQPPRLDDG